MLVGIADILSFGAATTIQLKRTITFVSISTDIYNIIPIYYPNIILAYIVLFYLN